MKHAKKPAIRSGIVLAVSTLFLSCLLPLHSNAQADIMNLTGNMEKMQTTLAKDGNYKVGNFSTSSVYVQVSNGKISGYLVKGSKNNIIPSSVQKGSQCKLTWIDENGKKIIVTVPCKSIKIDQI